MGSSLNGTGVTFSNASTQSVGTSGDFQFNSGYGSEAVAYGCRAWVNFQGTGTVAIRASGNVTSITDNAIGNYTVNFTNAMPDTNYSAVFGGSRSGPSPYYLTAPCLESNGTPFTYSTTAVQAYFGASSGGTRDSVTVTLAVFR